MKQDETTLTPEQEQLLASIEQKLASIEATLDILLAVKTGTYGKRRQRPSSSQRARA